MKTLFTKTVERSHEEPRLGGVRAGESRRVAEQELMGLEMCAGCEYWGKWGKWGAGCLGQVERGSWGRYLREDSLPMSYNHFLFYFKFYLSN